MQSFIKWVYGVALSLGGPGLFVVAFLDSSFISLPQINDLLVVLMVVRNKTLMPYYAAMATAGSVAGCYVLYLIAERGGEAFLAKRVKAGHTERALALYRRRGVLALMVPAILPPPANADVSATLDVEVNKPGPAIPNTFYGLMTEEINHSYDGGLFAELIQNRSFQDPAPRGRG